jgi:hypothetical protein
MAAALLLAVGQLANAVGVKDTGNGHMQVLYREYLTLFHGDKINLRALLLSVTAGFWQSCCADSCSASTGARSICSPCSWWRR